MSYLANVDEAAHEILVAQRVDSSLCLVSGPVLNNSGVALAYAFDYYV